MRATEVAGTMSPSLSVTIVMRLKSRRFAPKPEHDPEEDVRRVVDAVEDAIRNEWDR